MSSATAAPDAHRNAGDCAAAAAVAATSALQAQCGPWATHRKYNALYAEVESLSIKRKREIFRLMRTTSHVSEQTLLTHFGFTAGEYAYMHILAENGRKDAPS